MIEESHTDRQSTYLSRTDQWIDRPALDADQLAAVADELGDHGPMVWLGGRRRLAAPVWLLDRVAALLAFRGFDRSRRQRLGVREPVGRAVELLGVAEDTLGVRMPRSRARGFRFHDLRSVAASAMVAAGVDVKTAQHRLGHAKVTMALQVYAGATEEADRRAADLVGDRFRPWDKSGMEG